MVEYPFLIASLVAGVLALAGVIYFVVRSRRREPTDAGAERHPDPGGDPRLRQMRQLTPAQFQRICHLHTVLAEANPVSLEEWIAGFEADSQIERELRVYEAVAATYLKATRQTILSSQEKQKFFEDLVVLSYDPENPIVHPARLPRGLPPWEEIVGWYREELGGRGRS
ncbi:MAG: hypothetical protein AB1752_04010 [Candidatus Zixiibacteriota bacterium]